MAAFNFSLCHELLQRASRATNCWRGFEWAVGVLKGTLKSGYKVASVGVLLLGCSGEWVMEDLQPVLLLALASASKVTAGNQLLFVLQMGCRSCFGG